MERHAREMRNSSTQGDLLERTPGLRNALERHFDCEIAAVHTVEHSAQKEGRGVVRWTVECRGNGSTARRTVVHKSGNPMLVRHCVLGMKMMAEGGIPVPSLVYEDPEYRWFIMDDLGDRSLAGEGERFTEDAMTVISLIANIHLLGLRCALPPALSSDSYLDVVSKWYLSGYWKNLEKTLPDLPRAHNGLRRWSPDKRETVAETLATLTSYMTSHAEAGAAPSGGRSVIHGDFHFGNLMLHDGTYYVIDFDYWYLHTLPQRDLVTLFGWPTLRVPEQTEIDLIQSYLAVVRDGGLDIGSDREFFNFYRVSKGVHDIMLLLERAEPGERLLEVCGEARELWASLR